MIEKHEILSLALLLERSDLYAVLYTRIDAKENTERMTYYGMSFTYPFFLIFLILICHILLLTQAEKSTRVAHINSFYHTNLKYALF